MCLSVFMQFGLSVRYIFSISESLDEGTPQTAPVINATCILTVLWRKLKRARFTLSSNGPC